VSLGRYAKKRDANERAIIQALEAVGARVWQLDRPVDLVVGYRNRFTLLEVKDGDKPPSSRKLTPEQQSFLELCLAFNLPAAKVETVDEALAAIGATRA